MYEEIKLRNFEKILNYLEIIENHFENKRPIDEIVFRMIF